MDKEKLECVTPHLLCDRSVGWMHPLHQVQHMVGVQQYTDQTWGQMESGISDPGGTIQTNGNVLWAHKFASNVSDDDEHYILTQSTRRMVLHLYG
jgi:hypothetical protein